MRSGRDKATFKSGVLTTLIATPVKSSASSRTTEAAATSPLVVEASASSLSSREQARETPRNPPSPSLLTSSRQMPAVEPSQTETSPSSQNSAAQEDAAASSTASGSSHQSVVQRLLEERRRKLEVDKKNREAAEKAGRKVKAEARKESIEAAPDSAKARQATYAQEQRKRNAEAKLERERILRQIEQDKADRKEKEERRKTLARIEAGEEISEDLDVSERLPYQNKAAQREYRSDFEAPRSKDCAVQVRLFDGSTIRSKFKPEQTITDLRDWVEKERSDDGPFTFKQILSPLPNRSIMISEEKDSLMQLGFVPSATLVMVPIMGYAAAYRDAGPGLMSNLAALPFNVVAAGAGLVPGALRTLLGFGQAVPAQGEPSAQTSFPLRSEPQASTIDSGINVRTLRDQREERDDYQLYNGNQVRCP